MEKPIQEAFREGSARANAAYVGARRRITVDPITRLEGHGKIDIFLDDKGDVERAYFQVPELRGFEVFSLGRPAEDMPQITSRICGVCPTAHHMAATKALDDLYKVDPPSPAKKLRELIYNTFMLEDHALHVFILGGPDFIVGPDAPASMRNVLGVVEKAGLEVGKRVISTRRRLREFIAYLGGKVIHPVFGLPGGVSKGIAKEDLPQFQELCRDALDFALFTLQIFRDIVLKNDEYVKLITSDAYTHRTHYMGLVDANNCPNFYDGLIRVVSPEGKEVAKFPVQKYLDYVAEHVEPWSYVKFCYLRPIGWKGFVDGPDSGIYSVAPLARLNASERMATPEAQKAREEYFATLGYPVHHTLANHWARVIEMVYAAERMNELINDPEITSTEIRRLPTEVPSVGIGVVEAPRGTLIHHYETDERGVLTKVNLIVATQNNSARMAMSVEKAAKSLIRGGQVDDGLLNKVEMAFRAYDPCHACATHSLPGQMPLIARIRDQRGNVVREIRR
ncbi:MAG: Ni/Fe hydrogenase subunit alpha [Candidatus Hydrogenedentota bacterium]|jgi:F420-non-reducing hydrogenase large subunit|uniref:Group 3c [NiFe]-hydrogenase, alpha subunit n=1 Tax=Sumerlaea chitinivorans TaxID=2250252 RepID=A0A2Z4Y188_SUMC1|nr:Group 3c [NiFe]- hydrogenase, alpha subunit [Candidatus Sumerlaea chitinivorans]RMH25016.1 MAG: Ni/Fe hydrogenase subunit alpha [Candidatus Hydrogenedentota bacterium]GIX44741.1 MAG: F420-non-reducing hydrogenase subunit A, selenocysteine-containing [Candidatus Sumerlaea sp.]